MYKKEKTNKEKKYKAGIHGRFSSYCDNKNCTLTLCSVYNQSKFRYKTSLTLLNTLRSSLLNRHAFHSFQMYQHIVIMISMANN
jgi:hypothetical protein